MVMIFYWRSARRDFFTTHNRAWFIIAVKIFFVPSLSFRSLSPLGWDFLLCKRFLMETFGTTDDGIPSHCCWELIGASDLASPLSAAPRYEWFIISLRSINLELKIEIFYAFASLHKGKTSARLSTLFTGLNCNGWPQITRTLESLDGGVLGKMRMLREARGSLSPAPSINF
jgi:hypothetical protein